MNVEILAGILIIVTALAIMIALVAWSRWSINRIAENRLQSVRDIIREFKNGG